MARPRKAVDTTTYEGRFATRLKQLREKAGLTHEKLGELVGVSPRTIYFWESSQTGPQLKHFLLLAEALNIEVRTLFPKK